MRMVTASGRSRWPIVIGAAALVIAVGAGIAYTATYPTPTPNAAPSAATATPTPSGGSARGIGDDVAPTGCLGGQDRNVNMVLAAQANAKHTSYGAVEVATSVYRWLWQYPNPPASESDTIASEVVSSTASAAWKDVAAQYESDEWNTIIADYKANGGSFHTSSTNGLWRITEDSTADRVNVELALGYVIDGALSPTRSTGIGLVLVWEDDAWHIQSGTSVDQPRLAAGGTRYTAGC
jgi:hypothetical protein